MKNKIFMLICICTIAFWLFSCAPSPENATSVYDHNTNYILLGFWHGVISPLALFGKTIGLNIGIWDSGKKEFFSYWIGYFFALTYYFRFIRFVVLGVWERRKI